MLVLPGVSRRSLSTTSLMGSRTRTGASPAWAATTTSVTLSLPRLNCTQVHRLPPLAEHVLALSAYPTACTGGHRYIVVQTESDQTGFLGSLVAYALS